MGAALSPAVLRPRLPAGLATRLRHLPLLGDAVNIRRAATKRARRAAGRAAIVPFLCTRNRPSICKYIKV